MEGQPVRFLDSQIDKAPQAIVRYLPDYTQASRTSAIDQGSFNFLLPHCKLDQDGVTFLALADDPLERPTLAEEKHSQTDEAFSGSIFLIGGKAEKCFDEAIKL